MKNLWACFFVCLLIFIKRCSSTLCVSPSRYKFFLSFVAYYCYFLCFVREMKLIICCWTKIVLELNFKESLQRNFVPLPFPEQHFSYFFFLFDEQWWMCFFDFKISFWWFMVAWVWVTFSVILKFFFFFPFHESGKLTSCAAKSFIHLSLFQFSLVVLLCSRRNLLLAFFINYDFLFEFKNFQWFFSL